jgi:hypothetical protein
MDGKIRESVVVCCVEGQKPPNLYQDLSETKLQDQAGHVVEEGGKEVEDEDEEGADVEAGTKSNFTEYLVQCIAEV